MKSTLIQFLLLFLATYGLFYFSYKYYIINLGGLDFVFYHDMYLKPLDFSQSTAPFVFRQLSAIVTNLIYEMKIFYNTENAFQYSSYNEYGNRILFSAMLSNYIGLLGTAVVVMKTFEWRSVVKPHFLLAMFAGLLCFLSFFSQQAVLTGLTEGWSWFLLAVLFFFYLKRKLFFILLFLSISVFQRETVSIVLGGIAFIDWLWCEEKTDKNFHLKVFLISLMSFGAYIAVRKFILPVEGYEEQMNPTEMWKSMQAFEWSASMLFQGFFTQNIYFIFLVSAVMSLRKQSMTLRNSYLIHLTVMLLGLYVIGMATGIEYSIGRIGSIITPIAAPSAMINFLSMGTEQSDVT